jgi:DNA-binding Lrp family transcriptional regulator
MKDLDPTDLRILEQLQADASLSNVELARRVHLSPSPCLARVRALEARGLIRQYVALLDAPQLGLHLNVFISISLKQQSREALQAFEDRVCARDEVMECYLMTGDADYLLRVVVADIESYQQFLLKTLTRIPGVAHIQSSFTVKPVLQRAAPPLAPRPPARSARGPRTPRRRA